ncbi:UDPglucose 6-dehydrogenase [Desulfosalsimonas propionicica]|uniref:UDP-glucose 6-dehydrogenase n=1 Tax=Desulfosalsimonas propionicica TaxID=332175 RepID=A0A7W0HLJ8_9BACT|nr:UDP-glucose/GDP-mannose dehydrogenase family protein [Desulfosalsimonas propionicica]MBA2882380.1 UDPglucose 6-dehydrogenase [Desulfosalsimonas propionicica]
MNVCIVGTGYVGLVTAACLAETGNHVFCVDINDGIIQRLKTGDVHIFEPGLEELVQRNLAEERLVFTTSLKDAMASATLIFSCVGTPSMEDGSCDLSAVYRVAGQVGDNMEDHKIVVNKSTVPVGTAARVREIISERLAARGVSLDFDVVSNPEFLKEGDAVSDFMKPDRIIIGTDNPEVAQLMENLYEPYARSRDKLILMSPKSAEMTKYAANCMLAAKISFINEIANICEKVGADVRDVRAGIGSDHRIGYHFIYPGVGYGGSCFPKDVRALIHTAADLGYVPEVLSAVDNVNNRQRQMVARKVQSFFESAGGVSGRVLAVWGLSFKANTDDIRHSPAIDIVNELSRAGMQIRAFDPGAGQNAKQMFAGNDNVSVGDKQYEILDGAHALAVLTDWHQFRTPDFPGIEKRLKQPVIFDARNLYSTDLIVRHNFTCIRTGRPDIIAGPAID